MSEHVNIRSKGSDDGESLGVLLSVLGVEYVDRGPELVEVVVGGVEPVGGHSDVLQQEGGHLQCSLLTTMTMTFLAVLTCSATMSQKVWAGLMVARAGKMSQILTR